MPNSAGLEIRFICDICGGLATNVGFDFFQEDDDDIKADAIKFGCKEHPAATLVFCLDGTVLCSADYEY